MFLDARSEPRLRPDGNKEFRMSSTIWIRHNEMDQYSEALRFQYSIAVAGRTFVTIFSVTSMTRTSSFKLKETYKSVVLPKQNSYKEVIVNQMENQDD